jgi:hypothetical protein
MRAIWMKSCAAAALVVLSNSAMAADHTRTGASRHIKRAAAANGIAQSHFVLVATRTDTAEPKKRGEQPATANREQAVQFGDGLVEYVEGPSWSYQHAHRGPVIEMGALGGGAMEDAPFLAHVALAWRF